MDVPSGLKIETPELWKGDERFRIDRRSEKGLTVMVSPFF
jgi:hypothetical protein